MITNQINTVGLEKLEVDWGDRTRDLILSAIGQFCREYQDQLNGKVYLDDIWECLIWVHPDYKDIIKRIVEETAEGVEELYYDVMSDALDCIESDLEELLGIIR